MKLKFPVVGKVVIKAACARYSRTMSSLMSAGIPLMEALKVTAKIMGNVHFEDALNMARDKVSKGQELSKPLEESRAVPAYGLPYDQDWRGYRFCGKHV